MPIVEESIVSTRDKVEIVFLYIAVNVFLVAKTAKSVLRGLRA